MGFKSRPSERSLDELLSAVEGIDVEYKESASNLKPEVLSAFANSSSGGTVLIGVKDQTLEIVDVPLSDEIKKTIENRASSCHPPLRLTFEEVEREGKRLVRIDIPSSPDRPHGTSGGTYKLRVDGVSRGMRPNELLELFMLREAEQFATRFEAAVANTTARFEAAAREVGARLEDVGAKVDAAESTAGWADQSASNASDAAETLQYLVEDLKSLIEQIPGVDSHHNRMKAQKERRRELLDRAAAAGMRNAEGSEVKEEE